MTHPAQHLDDEILSALVDDQLTPDEAARVQAHLGTCSLCPRRLEELRSVSTLLRRLPSVDPPRDFSLGPRRVADPANVVRLRRLYTATRVGAATLAAAWLLLSAGALYLDSRPTPTVAVDLEQPRTASAPAPAARSVPPTTAPARAAAPAASPQVRQAAGASQQTPQSDDQVAAATSVSALPTAVPTPSPTAVPRVAVPAPLAVPPGDPAAPLRLAAIIVGGVTLLTLLATFVIRHRLRHAAPNP